MLLLRNDTVPADGQNDSKVLFAELEDILRLFMVHLSE
jgi:hypothetical protein